MSALSPFPRLLATEAHFARLQDPAEPPLIRAAEDELFRITDRAMASREVDVDPSHHNAHLVRAREVQGRVLSLLIRWRKTGERACRDAALAYVRDMGEWAYWSWIAYRRGEPGPLAIFDLSYGENCATLALAYDWLGETIVEEERALLLGIARRWGVEPFLHNTSRPDPPFWYHDPGNNWNTVCTGGAGMVALAMYEHLEEAEEVLKRVDGSFEPYMRHLDACGGGWAEGVGYWNFGMLYAYRYLLSWTRAHGRRHGLLELDGASRTLGFPMDFAPNGVAAGFGDVNRFRPMAFHYAAAEELGRTELYPLLDAELGGSPRGGRANAAELLLFHPRTSEPLAESRGPVAKRYPTMDWAILADATPTPSMYVSIRGGSTKVNHSHLDLMSFTCVVGDEALLANVGGAEYMDSTFSPRRHDLFEIRPDAKNTVFINGVGIAPGSDVTMEGIEAEGVVGYRVEGAGAMGEMRDGPMALACNRAFVLIEPGHVLIVDRFRVPQYARYEARFHTRADARLEGRRVEVRGERQTLHMALASTAPAGLHRAVAAQSSPELSAESRMIRWCTAGKHREAWFATLLSRTPGGEVAIEADGDHEATTRVEVGGATKVLRFNEALAVLSG